MFSEFDTSLIGVDGGTARFARGTRVWSACTDYPYLLSFKVKCSPCNE